MDTASPTVVLLCPQCSLANDFAPGKRTDELRCAHCGNTFRRCEYRPENVPANVLPMRKRRNLKSLNALRKAVADKWNDVESGRLSIEEAKGFAFLAQTLKAIIEAAVLERKVKAYEAAQKNGPTGVVR